MISSTESTHCIPIVDLVWNFCCTGNKGGARNFFRVGWNWTRLKLGFVIGIQTGLGLGLFKKKKKS